jgi:hypothetical protein
MNVPQITRIDIALFVGLMLLIGFAILIQTDNTAKDIKIASLTANITKLNTSLAEYNKIRAFVYDYNEYSEICSGFQLKMKDSLARQCTAQGLEFRDFYVSYPANDYLVLCADKDGKVNIMRFR